MNLGVCLRASETRCPLFQPCKLWMIIFSSVVRISFAWSEPLFSCCMIDQNWFQNFARLRELQRSGDFGDLESKRVDVIVLTLVTDGLCGGKKQRKLSSRKVLW